VALAVLTALAEGEQRALGRDDEGGDAIGVVAVFAGDEKRTLHGIAVGAARGGREQHAARQDYGFEGSHKWHGGRVRPRPFPQGTNGVTRRSSIQPISAPQPPPPPPISAAANPPISVRATSP